MRRIKIENTGPLLRIGSNKFFRITSNRIKVFQDRRLKSFLPVDTGVSTAAVAAIKIRPPIILSSRVAMNTELLPDFIGFGYGEFGDGIFGYS